MFFIIFQSFFTCLRCFSFFIHVSLALRWFSYVFIMFHTCLAGYKLFFIMFFCWMRLNNMFLCFHWFFQCFENYMLFNWFHWTFMILFLEFQSGRCWGLAEVILVSFCSKTIHIGHFYLMLKINSIQTNSTLRLRSVSMFLTELPFNHHRFLRQPQ